MWDSPLLVVWVAAEEAIDGIIFDPASDNTVPQECGTLSPPTIERALMGAVAGVDANRARDCGAVVASVLSPPMDLAVVPANPLAAVDALQKMPWTAPSTSS